MPLAKTIRLWECDHCGTIAPWGDGWRSKLILCRTPVPHDEEIVACSEGCAMALDERRKFKEVPRG